MWNHIRSPPYAHRNPQTGEIAYIHGSSDGQLIAETYIVIFLYALICVGFVLLNEKALEQEDIKKKRIFTLIGAVMVIVFFSLLLSVFRSKYHGYPYRLVFWICFLIQFSSSRRSRGVCKGMNFYGTLLKSC